jgi:hypothetical protein
VQDSRPKRGGRLNIIGILVLLLGFGGAGLVYWTGAPPEDLSDDLATTRAYKTETRNIEMNFGKMGLLMTDLMEDLSHPGTQAGLIAAASILVASGCFFCARRRGSEDQSPDPP